MSSCHVLAHVENHVYVCLCVCVCVVCVHNRVPHKFSLVGTTAIKQKQCGSYVGSAS